MISQRIKELRLINDMTQAELAAKLGISSSAVGMYEQGRRKPDSEMLKSISKVFDVSVDYLLGNNTSEDARSKELIKFVNRITDEIMVQQDLIYEGKVLRRDHLDKIVNGMRFGMQIVLKQIEKDLMN